MSTPPADVAQWIDAASNPRVSETLLKIFEEAADAVRSERPLCIASGRCCRFEEHGHRLYVTGLEVAWFLQELERTQNRSLTVEAVDAARARGECPLLENGLCSVHEIRPFGCRSYFCDPRAQWQADAYERWHAGVRDLHEELGIPYSYGEWREMLKCLLCYDGD